MWVEYKFSIKTLVLVCFLDNWKNSQTLNNASQWTNKDQQVQTILVRSAFISSKPTHPQFEANEDSWGLWQQLTNCTTNLWKHRSQLIFCKNSKNSFQECITPLLVHSIFWRGGYWFFWALLDVTFVKHTLKKIFTLKLQSPSSLLRYNTLLPPPLSYLLIT
jgi:hypothetical protein